MASAVRTLLVTADAALGATITTALAALDRAPPQLCASLADAATEARHESASVLLLDLRMLSSLAAGAATVWLERLPGPVIGLASGGGHVPLPATPRLISVLPVPCAAAVLGASLDAAQRFGRMERRLERAHAVLRALRTIRELPARVREPQALLDEICLALASARGYLSVLLGQLSPDGGRLLRLAAAPTELAQALVQAPPGALPPCWARLCQQTEPLELRREDCTCSACASCCCCTCS